VDLAAGATLKSPLIISILWAAYNMIPPLLVVSTEQESAALLHCETSSVDALQLWLCRFLCVQRFKCTVLAGQAGFMQGSSIGCGSPAGVVRLGVHRHLPPVAVPVRFHLVPTYAVLV